AEETRRKEEADKQRFLRLRSEAGLAQMFGSGASPAMKERSSRAFDEMLVAQKDMLSNKFNTTPAAIDSAVQEAKKLLDETEIGAANLLSVLQKIVAVTNNQTAALKNVEEKINNLPLK
ncbi:MAG: hypothetical protein PHW08_14755, partial [Kiritimatiellae bacterium]|nr:hypothetical protein [Kiritimatiellia bacterium]